MALSKPSFTFICELAHREAAIVLEPGKEYLVESRLTTVARAEGFDCLNAFIDSLRHNRMNAVHRKVVEALTTNETFFFRDFHPFEALRKQILPKLLVDRAASKKLTIWSGASSTGQEAYSIAMLLREHFPQLASWKVSILGTDYCQKAVDQATSASYSQLEVNRGLPATYLIKYFTKTEDRWVVKEDIRRMVEFRNMNLAQAWPMLPAFDIVFMRNVMIYFDIETKKTILKKIRNCLLPHGYLFLGTAETTMNLDSGYKSVNVGQTTAYTP